MYSLGNPSMLVTSSVIYIHNNIIIFDLVFMQIHYIFIFQGSVMPFNCKAPIQHKDVNIE